MCQVNIHFDHLRWDHWHNRHNHGTFTWPILRILLWSQFIKWFIKWYLCGVSSEHFPPKFNLYRSVSYFGRAYFCMFVSYSVGWSYAYPCWLNSTKTTQLGMIYILEIPAINWKFLHNFAASQQFICYFLKIIYCKLSQVNFNFDHFAWFPLLNYHRKPTPKKHTLWISPTHPTFLLATDVGTSRGSSRGVAWRTSLGY